MSFRIKDLVVTVLSPGSPDLICLDTMILIGGGDGGGGGGDGGTPACPVQIPCTNVHCSAVTDSCGQTISRRAVVEADNLRSAELLILKAQLTLALQKIETEETNSILRRVQALRPPATAPAVTPPTLREVDLVGKWLEEALEEVHATRAKLDKSAEGEAKS